MKNTTEEGFDVIGDVHGMGTELVELLTHLGYENTNGRFAHPTRRAVFVGDFVDRGPEQRLAVETAKAMVDAGTALAVMGNHEFNAIAFHTPDPNKPGQHLRRRTDRNREQSAVFLEAVKEDSTLHAEYIEWFQSLPMWLDLDGLRVIHACWDEAAMANLPDGPTLTTDVLIAATQKGTPEYEAIETLLKGPEIPINPPYHDKDGFHRDNARFAWWSHANTLGDMIEVPAKCTHHTDNACPGHEGEPWQLANPTKHTERPVATYPSDAPPVLFGHYWRRGTPNATEAPNAACTDYSAVKGGHLVAYRWSGEQKLDAERFVWVG